MLHVLLISALGSLVVAALVIRWRLRIPSRRYEGLASVSRVYDTWTNERILERYWADHLHAGHYGTPPVAKDFVAAKVDFIDELIRWGVTTSNPSLSERLERPGEGHREPARVLDVGCGVGGSVRCMARRWPATAHVTGITISKAQARRAAGLTRAEGVDNATFLECDALNLAFADGTFDIAWAVESEPHVADKARLVSEMIRVLKPGGSLIIAAWNVRETRDAPLSRAEEAHLRVLLDEWCHARFITIREYVELLEKSALRGVAWEDWTVPTLPSWRHAIVMGMRDPLGLLRLTFKQRWALTRDAYTIFRFDGAFRKRLCEYGVFRGQKIAGPGAPVARAEAEQERACVRP